MLSLKFNLMKKMEPKIINLPKNEESRGYLTYIEKDLHIPFEISQSSWLYNIPESENISEESFADSHHAFFIPLSGSFEVLLKNGNEEYIYNLNHAHQGILIPSGFRIKLFNFSTNAIILKLFSTAESI